MLSPEQIHAIAAERGDTVMNPNVGNTGNPGKISGSSDDMHVQARLSQFDTAMGDLPAQAGMPPGKTSIPGGRVAAAGKPGLEQMGGGVIRDTIKRIPGEFKAGVDKMVSAATQDPSTQGIPGESQLGVASGAINTVFSPVSALIQSISEKASDSKHVQDFAGGNKTLGGLLDMHEQLQKHWDDLDKSHPELTKNVSDAANVFLTLMGGKMAGKGISKIAPEGETVIPREGQTTAVKPGAIDAGAPNPGVGATIKAQVPLTAKSIFSKIYRLSPDTADFLMAHPEHATPEALSKASIYNLSRNVEKEITKSKGDVPSPANIKEEIRQGILAKSQALNEHAKQYSTLGNNSAPGAPRKLVKVDPEWLRNKLEDKSVAGVTIRPDGRIEFGDAHSRINPADSPNGATIMQNLWDTYGPEFAKGTLSRDMFLKFRQSLATIANYKGGVDSTVEKTAHTLRDMLNKDYRKQLPGLEKLDEEHSAMQKDFDKSIKGLATVDPQTGEILMQDDAASRIMNATKETKDEFGTRLENIKPGILSKVEHSKKFNDEWKAIVDDGGNLRENALENIKNSLGAGKDIRLEKLEKLMPGITDHLKTIRAADEFNTAMKGVPGNYVGASVMSQLFTGNPLAGIALAIATQPNVGLKMLQILGKHKFELPPMDERGFIMNPFAPTDAPAIAESIQRHFDTMNQIFKEMPAEYIQSQGGDVRFLADFQQNVVKDLKSRGLDSQASAVEELNPKDVHTKDAFLQKVYDASGTRPVHIVSENVTPHQKTLQEIMNPKVNIKDEPKLDFSKSIYQK